MDTSKLTKVVQVYYNDDPKYPGIESGLVLELEDGRLLSHAQEGSVIPFNEIRPRTTPGALKEPLGPDPHPDLTSQKLARR